MQLAGLRRHPALWMGRTTCRVASPSDFGARRPVDLRSIKNAVPEGQGRVDCTEFQNIVLADRVRDEVVARGTRVAFLGVFTARELYRPVGLRKCEHR